jgi:hypothetical protein
MHKTGQDLLNLMFRPGETVCVSHNKYGYHSIPLEEALADKVVTLVPTEESCAKRGIEWKPENFDYEHTDKLTLVSLNPIKGWRLDENATAYRNFLVEMDYGPLPEQLAYAKTIGLPYSAVVFSGSKSLHFLISLEQDLPSYEIYYLMAEWTLAIATAADQNTKNPSRSIRIPGAYREPGKKQLIVEHRGVTKLADFAAWLAKYPNAKPKPPEKRTISEVADFSKLKKWVPERLAQGNIGAKLGRNKEWFAIACEFALAGYDEDGTMDILSAYFSPDRDFKEREWKVTIHSAFKYIYARKE